jgi:uncharacterized phage protein (predicted DNA packaging)
MSIVSLQLAKAHLNRTGFDEDDELISLFIRAAEAHAENHIGKPLSSFDPLPADLEVAILDLVAFRYQMRGIVSFGVPLHVAPHGIINVFDFYRENWFGKAATDGV